MLENIAGQRIWTHRQGSGASRLFIHCSLASHETVLPLDAAMPPATSVFFDLPGHGRSEDWEGADYHTDAMEIAAALVDEPAHVIGHSFGATVALRLAVERPDLVSRLTLIEPVMFAAAKGMAAHAAHQKVQAPFASALIDDDREAATRAFLGMWGVGTDWADIPKHKQDALTAQIHLIPAGAPAIEDDVHEVLNRLGAVTCSVDLICGIESVAVMPAIVDGLMARLPHAKRHVVQGAGHMVALTHPREVAAVIL